MGAIVSGVLGEIPVRFDWFFYKFANRSLQVPRGSITQLTQVMNSPRFDQICRHLHVFQLGTLYDVTPKIPRLRTWKSRESSASACGGPIGHSPHFQSNRYENYLLMMLSLRTRFKRLCHWKLIDITYCCHQMLLSPTGSFINASDRQRNACAWSSSKFQIQSYNVIRAGPWIAMNWSIKFWES